MVCCLVFMSSTIPFEENFLLIWRRFLEMEIIRSQHCLKLAGSANAYLVLQVICWHHFLLNIRETTDADDNSFDTALKLWSRYNDDAGAASGTKRLTFVAIERLTAIPFETVRRRVRSLEGRGWVVISDEAGINLNVDSPANQLIVEEIHPFEKQEFVKLLSKIFKQL